MSCVARLQELLDTQTLARLGAALWYMVGKQVGLRDLAWASALLGQDGDRLLLRALEESKALSSEQVLDPRVLARFLEQVSSPKNSASRRIPRLVWTLPPQHAMAEKLGCTYAGAIIEVIGEARDHIFMTSPFLQEEGISPLRNALLEALSRGVIVTILTHDADNLTSSQSIALEELRREAERLGRSLRVYTAAASTNSLLHAKLVVADGCKMVLGSANLTRPGLSQNLEAGVVLGERESLEMMRILNALIKGNLVTKVFGPPM